MMPRGLPSPPRRVKFLRLRRFRVRRKPDLVSLEIVTQSTYPGPARPGFFVGLYRTRFRRGSLEFDLIVDSHGNVNKSLYRDSFEVITSMVVG
jgi:hypothetical protein